MTYTNEEFLSAFFGSPNSAWPDRDPKHPAAGYLRPFLSALDGRDERPLVLPRRESDADRSSAYVVCWDEAHATRVRSLLEAVAAHSWAPFNGRVAQLDAADPIDEAVLRLVGSRTTYRMEPTAATHPRLWAALSRMVTTLESRPQRVVSIPRPVGRMLREFEGALSSGQADTSLDLLKEIEANGGISLENLAFLTVRRLSKLGQDADLLDHPSIELLVRAEPPHLIRDAILAAWGRRRLDPESLASPQGLEAARRSLVSAGLPLGLLIDERDPHEWSWDARVVIGLVALETPSEDQARMALEPGEPLPDALHQALRRLMAPEASGAQPPRPSPEPGSEKLRPADLEAPVVAVSPGRPPQTLDTVKPDSQGDSEPRGAVATAEEPSGTNAPGSWVQWAASVVRGRPAKIDGELVESWTPASAMDDQLAAIVDDVPDAYASDVLNMVGPFIDADKFLQPAGQTASALIRRYLLADRLSPGDLGSITALLEIALREAPDAATYRTLLEDIQGFASRWVSPAQPSPTLDMVDVVAAGPKPDTGAAQRFAMVLLEPLHAQQRRLSRAMLSLAGLIAADFSFDWSWTSPPDDAAAAQVPPAGRDVAPRRLLLYSLDKAVLARVSQSIRDVVPDADVQTSSDKVGNPRLRDLVRNADVVVIATRCATHAATGFINDHVPPSATVVYPDGAGSASMLRAVETLLA